MVHDEKEQPPPDVPEEIAKLGKYKFSSDTNPREAFWMLVKACIDNDDFAKKVKANDTRREAIVNVGSSILTEDAKRYRVKVSQARLAECLMDMIAEGGWEDALPRLFDNLYNRKKGPDLNFMIALGNQYKKDPEKLAGWLEGMLAGGRPPESVLSYVAHLGDAGLVERLRKQLLNISKTEINEPQIYSLEALALLHGKDGEVDKLFAEMMDDWDMRAKKVVLEHLRESRDLEVAKKALSIYPYEYDPYSKNVLAEIVRANAKGLREEAVKLLNRLGEKEAKELIQLIVSVYRGEDAMEIARELVSERTRTELLAHVK